MKIHVRACVAALVGLSDIHRKCPLAVATPTTEAFTDRNRSASSDAPKDGIVAFDEEFELEDWCELRRPLVVVS